MPRERVDGLLARAAENAQHVARETKDALPKFRRDYWWNAGPTMKVEMDPTRMGFGRGLEIAGADERVVTLHADISGSIRITDFEAKHPERKPRVFSVGIAEQNMMVVAAGLAKEGLIPVTGTYGVFASGRCWDQIRTTICYSNLNVKIAGAHGGISVGADGATHQALEEISLMSILPNMHVVVPCDSVETEKATLLLPTGTGRAGLHPLRARGDARGHDPRDAVQVRRGQHHPLPRRKAPVPAMPSRLSFRPTTRAKARTLPSWPAGRWWPKPCAPRGC